MKQYAGFVAGKTGTTDNENDAWFAGFTSDVTVLVWVGYDNARGKQTLGHGGTGGAVSVPIAQAPLPGPSAEAARYLRPVSVAGFTEYFRLDGHKKLRDTQHALAGRQSLARGGPMAAPVADEDRPRRQGVIQRPSYGPGASGSGPGYVSNQGPSDRMPRSLRELFRF
jgi:membrane peptidoglycan carboxypeptidase